MSGRIVIPHLRYWGENQDKPPYQPVTPRYVISYERVKPSNGQATNENYQLSFSDKRGRLHSLSVLGYNQVSLEKGAFVIRNFKEWCRIRELAPKQYRNPVRVLLSGKSDPDTKRGFILFAIPKSFLRPGMVRYKDSYYIGATWLSLRHLLTGRLLDANERISGKNKLWVPVPLIWEDYYIELIALTAKLNSRIKAYAKKAAKLAAAATLVEEMNKIVWRNAIDHKSKDGKQYVMVEPRLIRNEVLNPLRTWIRKEAKYNHEMWRRESNGIAARIALNLQNERHHQAFLDKWTKDPWATLPKSKSLGYCHAYCLVSRTDKGETLYKEHVAPFLKLFDPKSSDKEGDIKKAIDGWAKKGGWLKGLGTEIVAVAAAYGAIHTQVKGHANDLHSAMAFLAGRGLVKNWEEFDKEMNSLKEIFAKRGGKASAAAFVGEKYFVADKLRRTALGVKALNMSLHGLKVVSILMTDYSKKKRVDVVGDINSVIGASVDLSQLPAMQRTLGKIAAPVKKIGGRFTTVVDWGVSLYKLDQEDWKKDGYGFAGSVVSCTGKAFLTAGVFVAPPVGLVLAAVGVAILLAGGVIGAVGNPSSPDLQAYDKVKKQLFKICSGIDGEYRRRTTHKTGTKTAHVASTRTYISLRAGSAQYGDALTRSLLAATTSVYQVRSSGNSGGMLMNEVIVKHLTSNDWGVRLRMSQSDWQALRRLLAPAGRR